MYYYIMEQPRNRAEKGLQRKIRDLVAMTGLAGEVAAVSPARSVEELVEIATCKEYNTIVAVGSDKLINKIVSLTCSKEVVLGIIPLGIGPIIEKIIGISNGDLEKACQALKKRFIKIVDLAYLYPHNYFLTQAEIKSNIPIEVELEIDQAKTTTSITDLVIVSPAINTIKSKYDDLEQSDNRLNIYLSNRKEQVGGLTQFINWLLAKPTLDRVSSLFRARKFIVNSATPIPVFIDGKIIDKTPVIFATKPKALKIITSRGKIGEK